MNRVSKGLQDIRHPTPATVGLSRAGLRPPERQVRPLAVVVLEGQCDEAVDAGNPLVGREVSDAAVKV